MTAPDIRDGNRAVADRRVSTDDQSTSIQAQRDTCARIADQRGDEILGEFVAENFGGSVELDRRLACKRALAHLACERPIG
jgi:DNA invertase Pin-like site-specific DNA recombinase